MRLAGCGGIHLLKGRDDGGGAHASCKNVWLPSAAAASFDQSHHCLTAFTLRLSPRAHFAAVAMQLLSAPIWRGDKPGQQRPCHRHAALAPMRRPAGHSSRPAAPAAAAHGTAAPTASTAAAASPARAAAALPTSGSDVAAYLEACAAPLNAAALRMVRPARTRARRERQHACSMRTQHAHALTADAVLALHCSTHFTSASLISCLRRCASTSACPAAASCAGRQRACALRCATLPASPGATAAARRPLPQLQMPTPPTLPPAAAAAPATTRGVRWIGTRCCLAATAPAATQTLPLLPTCSPAAARAPAPQATRRRQRRQWRWRPQLASPLT